MGLEDDFIVILHMGSIESSRIHYAITNNLLITLMKTEYSRVI